MWDALQVGLKPKQRHYNITWAQHCLNFPKIHPHLHRHNSVRVDPYAHPQHSRVLNHFVYIWYGSGMHFKWVWSLNNDITTSLGLSPVSIFLKSTPHLHMRNSVRVDPYAHPQHTKVLKHFVYISYGSGMSSTVVCSLSHHITTSLRLNHTPFFLKSNPTGQTSAAVWGWTHVPIHGIPRCWNTLYTYDMDMGCTPSGFGASTMTLQHHSGSTIPQFSSNPSSPALA